MRRALGFGARRQPHLPELLENYCLVKDCPNYWLLFLSGHYHKFPLDIVLLNIVLSKGQILIFIKKSHSLAVVSTLHNPARVSCWRTWWKAGVSLVITQEIVFENGLSFWVLLFLCCNKVMEQVRLTRMLLSSSVVSPVKPCKWTCKPGWGKCKWNSTVCIFSLLSSWHHRY